MANDNKRKFSSIIVDGVAQAPSRAMLHAVGFSDDDFKKPQVGIASTWSMVTPCNMHINKLADDAAQGVDGSGGKSVIFNTITVSDGISMGTPGMCSAGVTRSSSEKSEASPRVFNCFSICGRAPCTSTSRTPKLPSRAMS